MTTLQSILDRTGFFLKTRNRISIAGSLLFTKKLCSPIEHAKRLTGTCIKSGQERYEDNIQQFVQLESKKQHASFK